MEGRAGLSRPAFFVGASPMGFCRITRDPLQCFEIPGVGNAGVGAEEGSTIQSLAWLDLTFLQKLILETSADRPDSKKSRRAHENVGNLYEIIKLPK